MKVGESNGAVIDMEMCDFRLEKTGEMVHATCIICDNQEFRPYMRRLYQCISCGHVFAYVDMTSEALRDFYGVAYFNGAEYYNYINDIWGRERNFKRRLKDILKYRQGGNLLEIGSAYGIFLHMAKKYFSTLGYEVCQEAAKYAQEKFGVNVKTSNFLEDDILEESLDVVVMLDVIEHLFNPQVFLAKISRLLKKNGIFFLTTGDIGSLPARFYGGNWRLIHPPTHIHYFSQQTIARLFHKNHLHIVDIRYRGYWRSLRDMLHYVSMKYPPFKGFSSWLNSAMPFQIYWNTFDIMQVVGRKC